MNRLTPRGLLQTSKAVERATTLAAKNISVRFEGLVAIDGVSLAIKSGEVFGLIGPNGAGKTTLVNVLTGFQLPSAGAIFLGERNLVGLRPHQIARAGVSRTFQNVRLFREYTVRENLLANAIGNGFDRRQAAARADEVLDWIGLSALADQHANTLSYGDERRTGIARALASGPAFLLLDEPAAGMTDAECDQLMKVIADIPQAFDCGVLLIEHNMRVVMGVCHMIHVIDFGRTIAEATPESVRRNTEVIEAYLGTQRSDAHA